jgi:endogenous inhibitor of DNA gyrase (YacG/DUF329 family)
MAKKTAAAKKAKTESTDELKLPSGKMASADALRAGLKKLGVSSDEMPMGELLGAMRLRLAEVIGERRLTDDSLLKCPACGEASTDDTEFCPFCGDLGEDTSAETVAVETTAIVPTADVDASLADQES